MKALLDYNQDKDTVCFYRDIENLTRYYVNIRGEIYSIFNSEQNKLPLSQINGEPYVYIKGLGKDIRIANIVNFAFKGLVFSEIEDLLEREIIYIDMDKTNLHPSNLMWGNRNAKPDKDGFVLIPGFSNYRINKEGTIIDSRGTVINSFKPRETHENSGKFYLYGRVYSDVSKEQNRTTIKSSYARNISLHRLIAHSFLPIPLNAVFKNYDINHIDGNPLNNSLNNLEWVTRRENNIHAVKNGLTSGVKPIIVREFSTGKVTEFF